MEGNDKTIEVMKAAMQKEKDEKGREEASMDGRKDVDHIESNIENNIENNIESKGVENTEGFLEEESKEGDIRFDDISEEAGADMPEGDAPGVKQAKVIRSLFKNNRNKESTEKDQKIGELTDRLMRTMAEFDNYRKRTDKEKSQMFDYGAKNVIEKLLSIIDNFERGLGTIGEKEKESAFAQGIEMIYKQMVSVLDEIGVKQIEAVGKEFDPAYHNAVMHGEDENSGENIVSEEFQKGYMYHDIVVRHSMVKVVN